MATENQNTQNTQNTQNQADLMKITDYPIPVEVQASDGEFVSRGDNGHDVTIYSYPLRFYLPGYMFPPTAKHYTDNPLFEPGYYLCDLVVMLDNGKIYTRFEFNRTTKTSFDAVVAKYQPLSTFDVKTKHLIVLGKSTPMGSGKTYESYVFENEKDKQPRSIDIWSRDDYQEGVYRLKFEIVRQKNKMRSRPVFYDRRPLDVLEIMKNGAN
jgi:hypothetical protein